MARPDILNQVRVRIENASPGDIFIPADFSDLAEARKITMCLSRLHEDGTLEKVKRGVYMKPRYSQLLNRSVPPREDAVAKAIARNYGWTIVPCGDTALNLLGLSTQVPAVWQYVSDGPYREYTIGNRALKFKHSANRDVSGLSEKSALIVQALKALGGAFPIGFVVQYVGAISQFSDSLHKLAVCLTVLYKNAEYLELTYSFLDIPNRKYMGTIPVEKRDDNEYEFEFRDVSFRYPGSEAYALRHLNFRFKLGTKLAVVGRNGSGKTTMIKLLCRLYDPTEGEILLNGINIQKYDYEEYMSLFSVVFQDYQLFSFTLGENVASQMHYDKEKAERCLDQAGFSDRLHELPNGLDTYLNQDFDQSGVELSGGEAQKVALARALYKDAPFVVLDEPTAALDPLAEYEIYTRFNDMVGSKTAVYISHRLSSCRFCDEIAVFQDGALVQYGEHSKLLADEDGPYYALWNAQAQYYIARK